MAFSVMSQGLAVARVAVSPCRIHGGKTSRAALPKMRRAQRARRATTGTRCAALPPQEAVDIAVQSLDTLSAAAATAATTTIARGADHSNNIHDLSVIVRDYDNIPVSIDFYNYAMFQLTAWILPMTIVGRQMGMTWENLAIGLCILGTVKTGLAAGGVIHY